MSTYIRCPECSFCIGLYSEFVDNACRVMVKKHIYENKQYNDYDPEKIVFKPSITPNLEPLFNALEIKNRCCRMHLIAKTEFDKIYK